MDQVKLESYGVPTVIIVAEKFRGSAEMHAKALGALGLPFAFVPDCFTSISDSTVREQAHGALDDIVQALTTPINVSHAEPPAAVREDRVTERFVADDSYSCFLKMNEAFIDRGWSDGFPLLPPTPNVVDCLVNGLGRAPETVVGLLPPAQGVASLHHIAVNAAMAGCVPAEMPVVVAAVRALIAPGFPSKNAFVSTGGYGQLYIVNGPIANQIGLNSGTGTLVPGAPSRVNMRLARAMRLTIMNVGHAYPTVTDFSTIGSPRKFNMFVGENVGASPWPQYHVEAGFGANDNVVTVFNTLADVDVLDVFNSTADGIATSLAAYATFPSGEFLGWEERWGRDSDHSGTVLLLVCPEHAGILAGAGWNKPSLRRHLHQHVRIPAKWFKNIHRNHPERNAPEYRWVMQAADDVLIPATESPDMFHIAVVGGTVGRSLALKCYGRPASVPIDVVARGAGPA